ncbi:MAG: 30S ribosomal protein S20 [bacterium]|nr:30S ribosomal protein S20 [bacterium]MBK8130355.1 30S ribosomal protein S20 [bacterium]
MPQHKSCEKRMRTATKARERNRRDRARCRTVEKRVTQAADAAVAVTKLSEAFSVLDRMADRGILHPRTAARRKARLARAANSLNS